MTPHKNMDFILFPRLSELCFGFRNAFKNPSKTFQEGVEIAVNRFRITAISVAIPTRFPLIGEIQTGAEQTGA